jgi:NHLM bacteriocin system ABC transporter ATP-binding protein
MSSNPTPSSDMPPEVPDNARALGAKDSFELVGRSQGWRVLRGMVDVFLLDRKSVAAGQRRHVVRVETGGLLFGAIETAGAEVTLLAVPGNDSLIAPFDLEGPSPSEESAFVDALAKWLGALADAMVSHVAPKEGHGLSGSQRFQSDKAEILISDGPPLWLLDLPKGANYADLQLPDGDTPVPQPLVLTQRIWLELPAGQGVRMQTLKDRLRDGRFAADLAAFHDLAVQRICAHYRRRYQDDLAKLTAHMQQRGLALTNTVESLVQTVEDHQVSAVGSINPLFAVCEVVAQAMGIKVQMPPGGGEAIDASSRPLELIARASRIQCRHVRLEGDWWRRESGPLVGRYHNGRPCALIPRTLGGYRMVAPLQGIRTKVTRNVAAGITPTATQLCEPLPDEPVGVGTLTRFCIKGTGLDALTITFMVLLAGTLSLVPPIATKEVFESVIPSNRASEAMIIGLWLVLSATSVALFNLVQGIALLRIEGRLDLRLQVALWDRLVRAPVSLFRDYSSGDLINRMQSVSTMRKLITGSVINSLVSSMMGTFSLGLMIYYAPLVSLLMALLTAFIFFLGFLLGWRLISLDRQMMTLNGRIQSLMVQLLGALPKIRVRGVEDIAFNRWARMFGGYQHLANMNGHAYVGLLALTSMVGSLALAVLFAFLGIASGELFAFFRIPTTWAEIVGQPLDAIMPTPSFIAFITAYVQFLIATAGIMTVGIRLTTLPPLLGRLKPLFKTPTEHCGAQDHPGEIVGGVEFKNVTFRYGKDGPTILNELSFSIEPGELVALVGPSGCGKSTAIRLLLGFESQESGSIYLDGRDVARLDKTLVREQLGVVVQDGRLIPGTILDNLTGGAEVSREEAWEAVEEAGFAEDIKNMPQGMDTPIKDDGSNISGGQRQRLLVARALIRKPRLLIMDEATSALDNETQEIVSRTVQNLAITRIVVAHRLSTILDADRIFVISNGHVVESGTYATLMEAQGVFAELARRQMG